MQTNSFQTSAFKYDISCITILDVCVRVCIGIIILRCLYVVPHKYALCASVVYESQTLRTP